MTTQLTFKTSSPLSLGIELELQLINPNSYDLIPKAKELINSLQHSVYAQQIKPEITQSMIEINSSIHGNPQALEKEMEQIGRSLLAHAEKINILISGSGAHPFQHWSSRKIYPTARFKQVSKEYGYLAKRFTVFAQHTHIGCSNPEKALYLTHMLARYVPQFIAMSASSPFYQGVDTGYYSSRANVVNSFPLCGTIPYVTTWTDFTNYYKKIIDLKLIESMKDLYWDIRLKPEFGTVEIRVCDAPLTIHKSVMIAAYIQTLCRYLIKEKPHDLTEDLYLVYNTNRFQATRYGYDGNFINPFNKEHTTIQQDILDTIEKIRSHAIDLGTEIYIEDIKEDTLFKKNDALTQKELLIHYKAFDSIVKKNCYLLKYSLPDFNDGSIPKELGYIVNDSPVITNQYAAELD